MPNDTHIYIYIYIYIYMSYRTNSRCCILYINQQIYVQNILNMLHTLRFFSSKWRLYHNATFFGSCVIHILYTGVLRLKKKIRHQRVNLRTRWWWWSFHTSAVWALGTVSLYSLNKKRLGASQSRSEWTAREVKKTGNILFRITVILRVVRATIFGWEINKYQIFWTVYL